MSSEQVEIPTIVLDDLCSRFIINIPSEHRHDLVRIIFAIEAAHWFYIDFYCTDDAQLLKCSLKDFAQQIFQHCPFLRDNIISLDEILSRWRVYKYSVPTYGAVLIDPSYEHVLLVRGFYNRESWGFPKGKVQENESPFKCAIREVMEEVGFDMKDRASEDQFLERELNGQIVRLYIVKEVPLETKFAAKTINEIKEMRWFPIADLPSHQRDTTPQLKLNLSPKAFFMVIPFIKDLRRWINQEQENSQRTRPRTLTYHGNINYPMATSTRKPVEQSKPIFQTQLSAQDTIHKHFSEILKNDSMTVRDETSMTETLIMKENSHPSQLTPPTSNEEENPASKSLKNANRPGHADRNIVVSNLTKDVFSFNGPLCWRKFRLNRSEVFHCLHE